MAQIFGMFRVMENLNNQRFAICQSHRVALDRVTGRDDGEKQIHQTVLFVLKMSPRNTPLSSLPFFLQITGKNSDLVGFGGNSAFKRDKITIIVE